VLISDDKVVIFANDGLRKKNKEWKKLEAKFSK